MRTFIDAIANMQAVMEFFTIKIYQIVFCLGYMLYISYLVMVRITRVLLS